MGKTLFIIGLSFLLISCKKEAEPEEICSTCYQVDNMGWQIGSDYFCGTLEQVETFEAQKANLFLTERWYCSH
jgi:hypothetical protein